VGLQSADPAVVPQLLNTPEHGAPGAPYGAARDADRGASAPPRWRVLRGTLQQKLLTLVVLSVVPTAIFAFLLALLHWQTSEKLLSQAVEHHAATLAATVEREIESVVARLRYLAASPALERARLSEFEVSLAEMVKVSPDIENLVVLDLSGAEILNTARSPPPAVARNSRPTYQQALVAGDTAAVSEVYIDPARNEPAVEVALPVLRAGEAVFVLVASLDLVHFSQLLMRHGMPENSVAAVLDARLRFVARTRGAERFLGQPAPAALATALRRSPSGGSQRVMPPDGPEVWAAWTALPALGWTVTYGTPSRPALRAQRWHLFMIFAGGAAVLLGGIALALVLSRELTRGLSALAARAPELAKGGTATLPRIGIDEIDRLAHLLEAASGQLAAEAARRSDAEAERDRLLASERQAREQAEEANRGKDAFLALLGHELRNPTSAIANAAHVLGEAGASHADRNFAAAVIRRQVQQLTRLVEDLLDVAKSAHGKLTLHYSRVNMQVCVQQAIEAIREAERARGRAVPLNLDLQPAHVIADPARIQQIVVNLVNNALAHTPHDGRIELKLRAEDREAVFTVSDNGSGIDADRLGRIFEPFYQGAADGRPRPGALGIGLTLVKRLAELHNGQVGAESAGPGLGSTFRVRLPLAPDVADTARDTRPTARTGRSQAIVLVEDNGDVRDTLRLALELAGHRVRAYADGESALAGLGLSDAPPDLAIVDIGLPGMDGRALARALRARYGACVLIVAFTGFGSPGAEPFEHDPAFDAHLLKPIRMAELEALLGRFDAGAATGVAAPSAPRLR
jgi:signal transduction histidine kinase